jgi:flagellar protein FliS
MAQLRLPRSGVTPERSYVITIDQFEKLREIFQWLEEKIAGSITHEERWKMDAFSEILYTVEQSHRLERSSPGQISQDPQKNVIARRNRASKGSTKPASEKSPVDLVLILYTRLLDTLRTAHKQIDEGTDSESSVSYAIELIQNGLVKSLDKENGGEIANNLAALYEWSIREIFNAKQKKRADLLNAVIEVFTDLNGAWAEISKICDQDKNV